MSYTDEELHGFTERYSGLVPSLASQLLESRANHHAAAEQRDDLGRKLDECTFDVRRMQRELENRTPKPAPPKEQTDETRALLSANAQLSARIAALEAARKATTEYMRRVMVKDYRAEDVAALEEVGETARQASVIQDRFGTGVPAILRSHVDV